MQKHLNIVWNYFNREIRRCVSSRRLHLINLWRINYETWFSVEKKDPTSWSVMKRLYVSRESRYEAAYNIILSMTQSGVTIKRTDNDWYANVCPELKPIKDPKGGIQTVYFRFHQRRDTVEFRDCDIRRDICECIQIALSSSEKIHIIK